MAVLIEPRPAALVTGARRDIGAEIAIGLAADGYDVALHHLDDVEQIESVAARCRALGARTVVVRADLGEPERAPEVVAETLTAFGRLDVLVNNAVRPSNTTWDELTLSEWHETLTVGLTSPFFLSQAAAVSMTERGSGRIVNISSVTVRLGGPSGAAYIAAKAGLVGMTRSLARQLGASGITVNAVSPGAIRTTNELELYGPDAQRELDSDLLARQALQRRLEPADIAGAVRYLCSREAEAVTGQVLEVNGGWVYR
ncbi:SDR family NAD(P)-dependent oxidoreductase [Pseudactinotalea suaedae]|uniref:SDR family NAD(P)-dependent oxidoreductase n=1 Tax=Pseudactinotalea suaedae TaxID=1524924 RepID=UPI0012E14AF3|nr:SDR family oxidoreductase [Pseudactinotalea suaedae]